LIQGTPSENSQGDGSESDLNEVSDVSDDAMLDAWQDMESTMEGDLDSIDDVLRCQQQTDSTSDVNGLLEADILLPTCPGEKDGEHPIGNHHQSLTDFHELSDSSWRSAAVSALDGPSGVLELQQLLDAPDHVTVSPEIKIRLREKLSCIEAWANEARLCHSGGRSLSDVRAVLEKGRAMQADTRLVGRLSDLVAAAESLRSRIATVLKVNSSGPDSLSESSCDLRSCRSLLQEAGRLPVQFDEQDQLRDCAARAEVAPCLKETALAHKIREHAHLARIHTTCARMSTCCTAASQ
jgi:hypothetical protein